MVIEEVASFINSKEEITKHFGSLDSENIADLDSWDFERCLKNNFSYSLRIQTIPLLTYFNYIVGNHPYSCSFMLELNIIIANPYQKATIKHYSQMGNY